MGLSSSWPQSERVPIPQAFCEQGGAPVLLWAPSAGEAYQGQLVFCEKSARSPPFVLSCSPPCAQKRRPPHWGAFCEWGGASCARFSTFRQRGLPGAACFFERSARSPPFSLSCSPPVCPKTAAPALGLFASGAALLLVSTLSAEDAPLGTAWFLGERSSPRYSSFCGPAPSPAMCSQANVSLRRGPTRATKVQQLLIFGVPRFFGGAVPGDGGLLPATTLPGSLVRFSEVFWGKSC